MNICALFSTVQIFPKTHLRCPTSLEVYFFFPYNFSINWRIILVISKLILNNISAVLLSKILNEYHLH